MKLLKNFNWIIIFVLIIISFNLIYSQENNSAGTTNSSNETGSGISDASNETILLKDIEIIKFFPREVKLGDVQFSIQVINNKNKTFENVLAVIKGAGFSSYDVVEIDKLGPYEKDYIFVDGNLVQSGEITLTIKIVKDTFYQKISVFDSKKEIDESEKAKKLERLKELSKELEELKKNYITLELDLLKKKENGYDISGIKLEDLKKYIRDVESNILSKDVSESEISLGFALEEYKYQKGKMDSVKIIPFLTRLKDNAILISAIIGAILASFALSELLKTKSEKAIKGISKIIGKTKEK